MKKLVCLLLTLALCLPMAGGLVTAEEAPMELTIAVVRRQTDITTSFHEKKWVQQAEDDLNMKLTFVELTEGAVTEPLAAILAGDLPDVFFMGMQLGDSLITQNAGLFRAITVDEIQTYCPTIYDLYEHYVEDWQEYLTYPNGNIYGLMGGVLSSEQHLTQGLQYLNYDWLERLGLDVPTNMDEFYDMLVAFRDQDANGNGDPGDEIPVDFCNQHYAANIMNFASAWGLSISSTRFFNVVDGNAIGTVNTPAFREFLEYFHMLGQEGLLNLEGFSQTQDQYNANLDSMSVGLFWGWGPYNYIKTDDRLQYEAFVPLGPEEYQTKLLPNQPNRSNRNAWVITRDCANWEAALRLYDYWCEPTRSLNVHAGQEGAVWEWLDQAALSYTNLSAPDVAADPEAYSAWAAKMEAAGYGAYLGKEYNGHNTLGYVNNGPLSINAASYDVLANPTLTAVTRILAIRVFVEADALGEPIPKTIIPEDAQEELDFLTDGMAAMINGFTAESIIHGVTDESWHTFQADLEKYNYGYYVDFYNRLCHGEI